MKWYDVFANFYDQSLEKLYFASRQKAVEWLDPHDGCILLDVACGTGANFTHILTAGKEVTIYATDFSTSMLRRATQKIEKHQWKNIHLFQADARELSSLSITKHTDNVAGFDRILCVLGLSVIPDWERVMDNLLDLLNENGKIVVVDVYAEKRDFNTWLVETIAKADLNRPLWQTLEKKTNNFAMEYLPVNPGKVGGRLFVASGQKKLS